MRTDFHDSHERHWQDAELLFNARRLANADHLYGIAAECGLKRLMQAFGMPFDSKRDWPEKREDRAHANGIWERFESYRSGHHQGSAYELAGHPFTDWDIGQRYTARSNFNTVSVAVHRTGAEQVHQLIGKAQREGLLG